MATNNLRIIYDNIVDYSGVTVTASTTASGETTTANLFNDSKAKVWRSATGTVTGQARAALIVNVSALPQASIVGGIMIPFTNLSSTATVRVRLWNGAVPTTDNNPSNPTITTTGSVLVTDTGAVVAAPYQVLGLWNWGALPLGVNSYAYGGGTYGRVWIPNQQQLSCRSITIEIFDNNNTNKYIEAARLIIGSYWTPKYNTSYGLSAGHKDMTSNTRAESGDLVSNRGVRFKTLDFDLKWLTPSDQLDMSNIIRANGVCKPMFISLFPDNSDDWGREQSHQIYGKLSTLSAIQYNMLDIYSTKISIEEV